MPDTVEEIASQLRAFIRAEADRAAPAAHARTDGFQRQVHVQPPSPPRSVEQMSDAYRQCLHGLTEQERGVLDRIIRALADAA